MAQLQTYTVTTKVIVTRRRGKDKAEDVRNAIDAAVRQSEGVVASEVTLAKSMAAFWLHQDAATEAQLEFDFVEPAQEAA
jgi:hypothetical protein